MSIITVADAKAHLNITTDADDALLERLIASAETFMDGYLETKFADMTAPVPDDLQQALFMLVAHWYEQREAVLIGNTLTAVDVPYGFWDIVAQHRAYSFGG